MIDGEVEGMHDVPKTAVRSAQILRLLVVQAVTAFCVLCSCWYSRRGSDFRQRIVLSDASPRSQPILRKSSNVATV